MNRKPLCGWNTWPFGKEIGKSTPACSCCSVSEIAGHIEGLDHRSTKSIVTLTSSFFPWELEQTIADFLAYYNTLRDHESLDNVTPADVYVGRQQEVLTHRDIVKQQTLL